MNLKEKKKKIQSTWHVFVVETYIFGNKTFARCGK